MTTSVLWNSHASVLIRSGEDLFLTDPWYGVAFSSWSPHPVPAINPDMLIGLAKSGRLRVIVSHGHGDHFDADFLAKLGDCPIYVPKFRDGHMARLLPNAVVIDGPTRAGGCVLNSWEAAHSAVVSIDTPDCNIFHGNDVYALPDETIDEIDRYHDDGRPRFYMGQGGSASGWPLRYRYADRDVRAQAKHAATLKGLHALATRLHATAALPYACFARVEFAGQEWLPLDSSGANANAICGGRLFVDMAPGDVYLPATGQHIPMMPSLSAHDYPRPKMPEFPDLWGTYGYRMAYFMDGIVPIARAHGVIFAVHVGDGPVWSIGAGARHKECYVSRAVMSNVLAGRVPFADISTGYLAEWSREPDEPNIGFLTELEDYGYAWAERMK